MMNASIVGLAALCVALPCAGEPSAPTNDAGSYRFQKAPVNAQGLQSLADLRGKPILIDFWGTR